MRRLCLPLMACWVVLGVSPSTAAQQAKPPEEARW